MNEPPAASPRRAAMKAPPQGRVILVVEADAWTRAFLVRMFRRQGYAAHAASGTRSALRRLKSDPTINVVLADVPPSLAGPALTAAAKALRPELDVVLSYGISRRLRPATAPAAAVDAFIIAEQVAALIGALPPPGEAE
jgi:DNA-binding NtrC family response regulator